MTAKAKVKMRNTSSMRSIPRCEKHFLDNNFSLACSPLPTCCGSVVITVYASRETKSSIFDPTTAQGLK